jgi:diguanylate cyclase (GGDEF)-like protein
VVQLESNQESFWDATPRDEVERLCIKNLLASCEDQVYFKDQRSRFLLVSSGLLSATAPGRTMEDMVGKTDFDMFSDEHAGAALKDEQHIILTGQPIVAKLERQTFVDRPDAWVSTTKMPLRDPEGQIVGTFGISRDVSVQIEVERALAYQALHDPVTGLANRHSLMARLSQALVGLKRYRPGLAILFVDLDNFKVINDSFGHDAGDLVLAEVGRRLSLVARRVDTVARLGGDEFIMLCSELRHHDVRLIADRIVKTIGMPYAEGGRDLTVTGSVGIAVTMDPRLEPDQLIRDADAAMYQAKRAGRNRYSVYDADVRAPQGRDHPPDRAGPGPVWQPGT